MLEMIAILSISKKEAPEVSNGIWEGILANPKCFNHDSYIGLQIIPIKCKGLNIERGGDSHE